MWNFVFVLPNLTIQKPIENEFVAIVPPGDDRLRKSLRACLWSRRYLRVLQINSENYANLASCW